MLKLGEKEALKGKMYSKSPARVSSLRGPQEGLVCPPQASSTAHTYGACRLTQVTPQLF